MSTIGGSGISDNYGSGGSGASDAASVSFVPYADITADNVQLAIEQVFGMIPVVPDAGWNYSSITGLGGVAAVDITGIPDTAEEIVVYVSAASKATDVVANMILQTFHGFGDGSAPLTSGYVNAGVQSDKINTLYGTVTNTAGAGFSVVHQTKFNADPTPFSYSVVGRLVRFGNTWLWTCDAFGYTSVSDPQHVLSASGNKVSVPGGIVGLRLRLTASTFVTGTLQIAWK